MVCWIVLQKKAKKNLGWKNPIEVFWVVAGIADFSNELTKEKVGYNRNGR